MQYDILIIGGGPAGLTAAIYACRGGWKTALVEMGIPGGQANTTDIIENYPGFPDGIGGPELMGLFHNQAVRFGCEFITDRVQEIVEGQGTKIVHTGEGSLEAKTVIIATGSQARELGVKGEREFRGRGVSYCATCDGFFFRGKKVAVVGGGDSAVKEAIYLAKLASEVTIIHRRDMFRAAKILGDQAQSLPNVRVLWDTVVDEIRGSDHVEGLKLHGVKTQEPSEISLDGVFLYVGIKPNTEFLGSGFPRDPQGFLLTDEHLATPVPGVYAAGDCRHKTSRQVATAVGDGAQVLMSVEEYLNKL